MMLFMPHIHPLAAEGSRLIWLLSNLPAAFFPPTLVVWLAVLICCTACVMWGIYMTQQTRLHTGGGSYAGAERRTSGDWGGNGRDDTVTKWSKAIGFVGVPAAALFFILYYAVPEMPKMVRAVEALSLEQRFTRERMEEQIALSKRLIVVTIRACRASARTLTEKDGCDAN